MNYLAHHTLARRLKPEEDSLYFVGNLLPDMLSLYGVAKVRQVHLPEISRQTSPLWEGMRLHFTTDVRFHGSPVFSGACKEVSMLLSSLPFSKPLHRVFFLSHIFVEIALDGYLLREDSKLATDLYGTLARSDLKRLNTDALVVLSNKGMMDRVDFAPLLERFIQEGWLGNYASYDSQADALSRICRRSGVSAFESREDCAVLKEALAQFAPRISELAPQLLYG